MLHWWQVNGSTTREAFPRTHPSKSSVNVKRTDKYILGFGLPTIVVTEIIRKKTRSSTNTRNDYLVTCTATSDDGSTSFVRISQSLGSMLIVA